MASGKANKTKEIPDDLKKIKQNKPKPTREYLNNHDEGQDIDAMPYIYQYLCKEAKIVLISVPTKTSFNVLTTTSNMYHL